MAQERAQSLMKAAALGSWRPGHAPAHLDPASRNDLLGISSSALPPAEVRPSPGCSSMPHPQSAGVSWESYLVVVVGEWFPADGLCGIAASSPTSQHWPGSPISQCWPGQEFCSGSNTVSALRGLMVWWETQVNHQSLWVVYLFEL